jgi:hypothetical protein
MSTAVVTVATGQLVKLDIRTKDVDWLSSFDRLEVWRSRTTEAGPFEEITSTAWSRARVPAYITEDPPASPVTGPSYNIVDKKLSVLINESVKVSIVFTDSDPLTLATISSQINAQGAPYVSSFVSSEGKLVLETVQVGSAATLRILPSEGAGILDLPTEEPDSVGMGREARIALVLGTLTYKFTDLNGSINYFYRTRFRNQMSGSVSEFSPPFSGKSMTTLDPSNLALGYVDVVDQRGRPVKNKEVTVANVFTSQVVNGRTVVGTPQTQLTDDDGHAEFFLVRGVKVNVMIGGTQLVKEVLVPTDTSVESFDLFDSAYATGDDAFTVARPNYEYAARRST